MARSSRLAIAAECLKDDTTMKYIIKQIGVILKRELAAMCSDRVGSILKSTDKSDFAEFSWEKIIQELVTNAPTFLSIMSACTHTRRERNNRNNVIGMCAALLLKYRFSKMSLVQRLLSLILYAGHSGTQVNFIHVISLSMNVIFLILLLGE